MRANLSERPDQPEENNNCVDSFLFFNSFQGNFTDTEPVQEENHITLITHDVVLAFLSLRLSIEDVCWEAILATYLFELRRFDSTLLLESDCRHVVFNACVNGKL